MSAMDNATRNAGEMINKLTLTYNRQRQAQITKELIEIISGAEALLGIRDKERVRIMAESSYSDARSEISIEATSRAKGRTPCRRGTAMVAKGASRTVTQVIGAVVDVAFRWRSAEDPERAGNRQPRQPPRARSRPAPRREHGSHDRHGLHRRSRSRSVRFRHRRADLGSGRSTKRSAAS